MHFRNNKKKITCKRSGLTTEEWNEKKAIETQKLQRNANSMFEFAQAQQGQMPFPMFSPHLGQAASFSPNMYQPQQWFESLTGASDNSYPKQQQLPGSSSMSTPQLSAGVFGQQPSANTLRAQRRRANIRRSREEEIATNLADVQRRLDASERELEAATREREQMREAQRRVLRRMEEENNNLRLSLRKEQEKSAGLKKNLEVMRNLKHEAQKQQKDVREQENIRGFESKLSDLRSKSRGDYQSRACH